MSSKSGAPLLNKMKVCTKCRVEKPLSEYSRASKKLKSKDGLQYYCKECCRWTSIARRYGIEREEYERMFREQEGKCLICESKFDRSSRVKKPCVDHCHKTERVRGLLCHQCNMALGMFKDSTHRLQNALSYLEQNGEDIV